MPHKVDRDNVKQRNKKIKSNFLTPVALGIVAVGTRGVGRSDGDHGKSDERRTGEEHGHGFETVVMPMNDEDRRKHEWRAVECIREGEKSASRSCGFASGSLVLPFLTGCFEVIYALKDYFLPIENLRPINR